jgi:hypothetical protein
MRRLFLTLGILLIFLAVTPAFAQQGLVLESVQVQFWPEYDDPAMLVIYTIELSADTPLPVEVRVPIPTTAGAPNAVAVAFEGRLVTRDYTREVEGEWADIIVEADSPIIHVEYYDPGLVFDGRERTFDYVWAGGYAVNAFGVRVQSPVGASNMSFSVEMGLPQTADDTLSYYSGSFGSLSAGEQFSFSMAYQKSSSRLTIDALEGGTTAWWIPLLVGLGVVMLGLGGWFYINDSSKSKKKSKSKYARKRSRGTRTARPTGGPARYCHSCGSKSQRGDKFCRECGEELRV